MSQNSESVASNLDYQIPSPKNEKSVHRRNDFEDEIDHCEAMVYSCILEFEYELEDHKKAIIDNWKVTAKKVKEIAEVKRSMAPLVKKLKQYQVQEKRRFLSSTENRRIVMLKEKIESSERVVESAQKVIDQAHLKIKGEELSIEMIQYVVHCKKKALRKKRSSSV